MSSQGFIAANMISSFMEDLQPEDWDCTMEQHSMHQATSVNTVIFDFLNLWHWTFFTEKIPWGIEYYLNLQHLVLNTTIVL